VLKDEFSLSRLVKSEQVSPLIRQLLDNRGFNFQVWAVAASGFFTGSYNLFATNVILPALGFVYWPDANNTNHESIINIATLTGTIIGQLLFGVLADRYGRQKFYGFELLIVLISTLGLAQSSFGFPDGNGKSSMSIFGWILFWRTIMGIGIGGEYPMSAIITSGE
jgi:PHS family inorganic phosphate transporter-like MFS transporter